jgi:prepilin-type N-terminal cleavage/methylation domain-containing protein
MFRKSRPKRSGFTLPEVLVTVAIVSVLAAIVVPTVTNQIGKGDDTNLQTNSTSIRTGITAFVSDVRRFPGRIQHLHSAPLATDLDVAGNAYGAAAVARWRGPYMTGSLRAPVSSSPIDSVNWSLAFAIDSLSDTSFTAANGFVGVTLGGVASTGAALHIDSLIDGGNGNTLGNLRWAGSPPTNERLILLLMGSR